MNITGFVLKNNRTTLVLFTVLLVAGISSYLSMPRAYDPGFIIRVAQVVTYYPGASPERIEQLVTDKLEKIIQEIPELDYVKSESRTGVSIVLVNIKESYKDMRPIWDSLRRKVDSATDDLPEGVIGPFVNDEFGDVFGIVIGITGEGFSYSELKKYADQTRDELLQLPDAAKVDIFGKQEERVFIEYNNARLSDLELSPSQLMQILSARNIIVPGGSITLNGERIELEPTGNFESFGEIQDTIIQLPGTGKVIALGDIANIRRGYVDPPTSKVRTAEMPGLALAISMREGGNNIELGKQVATLINRLQSQLPIGVDYHVINFSPEEVKKKVNDFVTNLVQAVVVVAAVMLLSLGLRTGLIVSCLIPSSMIMAMLVMSQFNIGLDQISLAALIIALGMLVDNGIVMSENIMVQITGGKSPVQAAIDSSAELKMPLLISSLTTAAAFLPIYLAESSTGEFTASLFKVVTITLLCSWVLSLSIIPLLCVYFLKPDKNKTDFNSILYRHYRSGLGWLLNNKIITLVTVFLLFSSAGVGLGFLPKIFFPPSDRAYFKLEVGFPQGTSIDKTEDAVRQIENFIKSDLSSGNESIDGITNWISYIGSGGPRFLLSHNPRPASSNYALMVINVTDFNIIDGLISQLDNYVFNHFPDADVKVKRFENGASINNPIEIRLLGRESGNLFEIADNIKSELAMINGVRNISDDWGPRIKKLIVRINQARALRAGVSSQDIAVSLQTGLSGMALTEYREGVDVIPVVMRTVEADRQDIGKVEALAVYSQVSGQSVPLRQVADIEMLWEPAIIFRRDRMKTITIGAQLDAGITASQVINLIKPSLDRLQQDWPTGYRYQFGGEVESSQKANQSIMAKIPIAAFIIIFLLVAMFNSIRNMLIIIVTIPLGVIGVVYGLLLGNSYFGFMTLLGIISLAGIVINNAIVLLETIKLEISNNSSQPFNAIIEASQQRLRPILLTTATTVLGLIPLYLGGGEMWEPMAIAIMAGLLFSTLLTLGIVPVLYASLYKIRIES